MSQIFHTVDDGAGDVATRRSGEGCRPRGGLGPADAGSEQPENGSSAQPPVACVLVVRWVARHASCSTGRFNQGAAPGSPRQCQPAERLGMVQGNRAVQPNGRCLRPRHPPRLRDHLAQRAPSRASAPRTSRNGLTPSGDDARTVLKPREHPQVDKGTTGRSTKSVLTQRIAQTQPERVERDVALAVNMMLEHMAPCLCDGGRV